MEIARLNVRITIQKSVTTVDEIGNHLNAWEDFFSCMATLSGEGGTETFAAGTTVEASDASFTVRWCRETKNVTSTGYRIVCGEDVYDILAVDHLSNKKCAVKFRCRKERKSDGK